MNKTFGKRVLVLCYQVSARRLQNQQVNEHGGNAATAATPDIDAGSNSGDDEETEIGLSLKWDGCRHLTRNRQLQMGPINKQ